MAEASMKGEKPEVSGLITRLLTGGGHGHLHRQWIDAIKQNSVRSMPVEDDFPHFHRINSLILSGHLAILSIPVDSGPGSDKDDEFNNSVLSRLPSPFLSEFKGGDKHDSDGLLRWTEPTVFDWCPDGRAESSRPIVMPPGSVDLEVGTTASWTTSHHATRDGGVARWPYENSAITVIVRVPKEVWIREKESYIASLAKPSPADPNIPS